MALVVEGSGGEVRQPEAGKRALELAVNQSGGFDVSRELALRIAQLVDQGAVLILTSVQRATYLQIPSDRWVFPWAGTDSHDTYSIAERDEYHR